MVQCNDGTHIEVQPSYDFTSDEWYELPEADKITIGHVKNDGGNVISEITTGGKSMVQEYIRKIQQRISAIESNADVQSRAMGSIMGGKNEQAVLRLRNTDR